MSDYADWSRALDTLAVPKKKSPQLSLSELLRKLEAPRGPSFKTSSTRILHQITAFQKGNIPEITIGEKLPNPEQLGLGDGRLLNTAFLYADVRGFSKFVAQTPNMIALYVLDLYFSEMTRMISECGGEVVDCAGDRLMGVFWRPANDPSAKPVADAVRCAFWIQTIVATAIIPNLYLRGLPGVHVGIGVDYGSAVCGRVGIRNRNKIVFLGNAANWAAKLQNLAYESEVVLSKVAYDFRPYYMDWIRNWSFTPEPNSANPFWYRSGCIYDLSMGADFPAPVA